MNKVVMAEFAAMRPKTYSYLINKWWWWKWKSKKYNNFVIKLKFKDNGLEATQLENEIN